MENVLDAPRAQFAVYVHDTYEPYVRFFYTLENAKAHYASTNGTGEGVYLFKVLESK